MTNPSVDAVRDEFRRNVSSVAEHLIKVFGLKYKREVEHLSAPLSRWMDFRLRYIDPQPRNVVVSDAFPKSKLPTGARTALAQMAHRFEVGRDVNPYQGRGLILRNDYSGSQTHSRTDLLWADWNITHLHLSDEPLPRDRYFSKPADFLLYCLVTPTEVAFIDVQPHPDRVGFSEPELFKTMVRCWPEYMNQFALKGFTSSAPNPTAQEIHETRESGLFRFLNVDGKLYMGPGMGITTATTPLRVTREADRVLDYIDELAEMACDPNGSIAKHERERTPVVGRNLSFGISEQGLAILDNAFSHLFILPRAAVGTEPTGMALLHDLFLPRWAQDAAIRALESPRSSHFERN
ncbi:hypothetical protein GTP58_08225 [Duganella sp. CY15W]|uniref:hypothetical protein n=1 Tax=Duganella sp. CY15W TaxID=2692172 RepID=UPI0013694492|nr:hypothetical protein [Duganella sp. CY15W]MYM28308.1 hypothetical protein [Duganella sp. CY15W]